MGVERGHILNTGHSHVCCYFIVLVLVLVVVDDDDIWTMVVELSTQIN